MEEPMNRRVATAVAAAGAVGALAFAFPLRALPPGTEGYNKSYDTPAQCSGGNTLVFHAPSDLWPPNHKYYDDIWVTANDAKDGDVMLTTDGTHDQYDGDTGTEANGSGHTADDITSDDAQATDGPDSTDTHPVAVENGHDVVTTDWDARAERAGTLKDGRTYTLHGVAKFSDGSSCEGSVAMRVPHDMRKSNR
jgi:hypothetical protein